MVSSRHIRIWGDKQYPESNVVFPETHEGQMSPPHWRRQPRPPQPHWPHWGQVRSSLRQGQPGGRAGQQAGDAAVMAGCGLQAAGCGLSAWLPRWKLEEPGDRS